MLDKVAVVGVGDLLYAFRALGIKVFTLQRSGGIREIREQLRHGAYALCFLQESLFEEWTRERDVRNGAAGPVVVPFTDCRHVTGYLEDMMRTLAVKATGSDSLRTERNAHEGR
jgi:vacuolar-type H+-ATPase subunit F/Vma7